MYSFPNMEPVCCSMSSFNCCFLMCIQVSLEANKVVWYSHLLKNSPQIVVIYTKAFVKSMKHTHFFWTFLSFSFFFKYKFIYFNWKLITLQYCIGFAIHKEIGTQDHLTCLLRNLYAGQETTELDMEQCTGSKLGKEYIKPVYCPLLIELICR